MPLTADELQSIDAGGLILAVISGIATVAATAGAICSAPPGTKYKAAKTILVGGIFLTLGAYELDCP